MKGKLVSLLPFDRAAAERSLAWVNDMAVATALGRCRPVTEIEHARWYEKAVLNQDNVFFAIYENASEKHVGNIWLWAIHAQSRNAELRILIGETASQGKGLGTEAVRLLLEFAFNRMNLHKVYLYVLASNERAVKAFQKNGFKIEGHLRDEFYVDGQYREVLRLGILAGESGAT